MTSYPELLDSMMEAILARDLAPAAELYRDKKDFPPQAQLAVYVEGYRLRLYEVVEATYPALLQALGPAEFRRLAEAFIEGTPSRAFNLDRYPLAFAEYVAGRTDDFAREVAQLEQAIHFTYQAPESSPLTPEWAARQTQGALADTRFTLRSASRLLAFDYPVNAYVTALREGANPARPAPAANRVLVLRHRHQVNRFDLAPAEYALLALLAEGRTLGEALEDDRFSSFALEPDIAVNLMQWFARWLKEGMLSLPYE